MASISGQITGTVVFVGQTEQVTDTFKKRTLVIKTDEQYPQEIKMQVTQINVNLLDKCRLGNTVTASFNMRGKSYQRKDGTTDWNLNLDIWKLEVHDNAGTQGQAQPQDAEPEFEDEVPF